MKLQYKWNLNIIQLVFKDRKSKANYLYGIENTNLENHINERW